jgi:GTPase Era involved in 16S rRNA processing
MNAAASDSLGQVLDRAARLVSAEQTVSARHTEWLDELQKRLREGHFHLAVLGQFKRGKSSFINALIGEAILPTAIVPLTALPTFVRWGAERTAEVFFEDDRPPVSRRTQNPEDIAALIGQYVAEEANPRNQQGVARVEVHHPAPILRQGLVLIDTPGVGSTFRHNTEATLNFLPQCDAALFVISADPPITEVEVAFLKQVAATMRKIIFVLNKADLLAEGELQQALQFLNRTLHEAIPSHGAPVIFPVSSRTGLTAQQRADAEMWKQSGMSAVEQHIMAFLATEKQKALSEAIARKAAAVLTDVRLEVELLRQSLEMPLKDLESKLQQFEEKIRQIEQQRVLAEDLLTGSRMRMTNVLEAQAEALRKRYRSLLRETAYQALYRTDLPDEKAAREALAETIPAFFERELGELSRLFNRALADELKPHEQRAATLIGEVRQCAANLFNIPYTAPESETAYIAVREPYWETHKWSTSLSPLPEGFFDRFLPLTWRRRRIQRRLDAQIEELVISNVENLRWTTLQNLNASFRRFSSELNERLRLTIEATRGAMKAAVEKRGQHAKEIADDVRRLRELCTQLDTILKTIQWIQKGGLSGEVSRDG